MPSPLIRNVTGTDGKENQNYQSQEYVSNLIQTHIYGLDPEASKYMIIDASVSVRHNASVTVTQHPVEIGADISDFAIVNPRQLTLEGRISMIHPLRNNEEADPNDLLSGYVNRVTTAWEILEDAKRNRRELIIDTNLKIYDGMLITSLATSQDWRTARTLDFTANIQEIIKVAVNETQLTQAQLQEGSTQQQASPNTDLGDVQPSTIEEPINLGG